jgi:predicted RNase H-like HicB family nuclease
MLLPIRKKVFNLKDRYIYPAIFYFADDGISIEFPDLPGCISYGNDEQEAITNAKEALELHLYGLEEDSYDIPSPSHIHELNLNSNEIVILIDVWMIPVRDYMKNKAIKKTLSIPKWLNDLAVESNINFSHLLQLAIKDYLGIKRG